ncbi:MAG TPA: hypothetical protein VL463_15490 [Kofleriaceae bacterium]|nr:hypothetical protein [Kofleriaceae bacterium]
MRRTLACLLFLGACGKVQTFADANGDGNGSQTDGAVTRVNVIVLDPNGTGAPISGVPVVFLDPSGAQIGHPSTTADGKASADMPNGGSITAVLPEGTSDYTIKTVLGVKGGDTITLNAAAVDNSTESFTVTLAALSGAANYYVYGPCGTQSSATNLTTATLTINGYCKVPSMDIVAIAYDANFNPLGWVEKSGITYAPGGNASMPATWNNMKSFTATATNVPAEATYVYVQRWWPDEYGYQANTSGPPTAGSFSANLDGPNSATAYVETDLQGPGGSEQRIRQAGSGTATAYNLNVGNNLLVWIGQPSLDVSAGKITIPTTGTKQGSPDLFGVYVSYSRTGDAGFTRYNWYVYASDVQDFTFPTLPAEVGDVAPRAGDGASFNTFASLVEYDDVAGYDAARQNPDVVLQHYFDQNNRASMTAKISQSPLLK